MPWEPSEEINQNGNSGNSLAIQWLGLLSSHCQGSGSISSHWTKIPQGSEAVQPKKELIFLPGTLSAAGRRKKWEGLERMHGEVWKGVIWYGPSAAVGAWEEQELLQKSAALYILGLSQSPYGPILQIRKFVHWHTIFPESYSRPHVSP